VQNPSEPNEPICRASSVCHFVNRSVGFLRPALHGTVVSFSIYETQVKLFPLFAATNPKLDGTNWNHAFYHNTTHELAAH
jgi:hypothetical protein